MEFRLLGRVALHVEGEHQDLGSNKERRLLAALALNAGRPVARDTLVDRLWDDRLPQRARENVHTYVSRLRTRMREVSPLGAEAPRITHRSHTYALEVDPDTVDAHRFQRLVTRAGEAAQQGHDNQAVDLLTRAEELWESTEALAGLPGRWPETARAALAEKRLSATISRIAAGLRLGRFQEQIGELSALVEQHPGDETLVGQLMLAHYGSGRYTETLRVHQRARQVLLVEFGSRPGAELNRLHRGVLDRLPVAELVSGDTGDQRPVTTVAPTLDRSGRSPVYNLPRQAPLVGRRTQLRQLMASVRDTSSDHGALVTLNAIDGMAGVGKTALAVEIARQLRPRYPDGQVYVNLAAHSALQQPLTPEAALSQLLRLFGTPVGSLPNDLEERAALWQTTLAGRRALIILDDAADPGQVRPLLPSTSPSLTIVTSRRHLSGLPDARSVSLDVLEPDEAVALFREVVGDQRVLDPPEVARVVRLCGHLPLAITLVANRLRSRPSWSLGTLAVRLQNAHSRLEEIRDSNHEIAAAFELSYQSLSPQLRQSFRRLGLHPGKNFGTEAAAALLDLPTVEAERVIETFLACHLLEEPTPFRYQFHDLVGEFARGRALSEDEEIERDRALGRLMSFYTEAADQADRAAFPHRLRLPVPRTSTVQLSPPVRQHDSARTWFITEHTNLLAIEHVARERGMAEQAALLSYVLAGYLDTECHWREAHGILIAAVQHWEHTANEMALCHALLELGTNTSNTCDYEEAAGHAERARRIAHARGTVSVEAEARQVLGVLHWHQGEYQAALTELQASLSMGKQHAEPQRLASAHNNLAITLLQMGLHDRALEHFHKAIAGFQEAGDQRKLARAWNNLSDLHQKVHDQNSARQALERAFAALESTGDRYAVATTRTNLADLLTKSGDIAAALPLYEEALDIFRSLGDRKSEANLMNSLGHAHQEMQHSERAVDFHRRAFELADHIGAAPEAMRALRQRARAELSLGRPDAATDHLRMAIDTAQRTGDREARTRGRAALVEVRLAMGDFEGALELAHQSLDELRSLDPPEASRLEGLIMRTTTDDIHD